MALSAIEIITDAIDSGKAKEANARRTWEGSGVHITEDKAAKRDARFQMSLELAQSLLNQAAYGPDDVDFQAAVRAWAKHEWGGYLYRLKRESEMTEEEKTALAASSTLMGHKERF
jgi:hypothetical protein